MALSFATRRLLKFLESRRGGWVSAVELRAVGLRFYRQRIYDLRRAGYRIEMHQEFVNGRRDTCYRLVGEEADGQQNREPGTTGLARTA